MSLTILPQSFFNISTIEVAKDLLGKFLVHKNLVGKIIETEAYLKDDPASHSFNGLTERNKPMFGNPGTAYVYFTYGMYHCFNVVTNKEGIGEAVLIRALEPIEGIKIMKKNRKTEDIKNLCSGPAKLVIAMNINKKDNGLDLLNKNSHLKLMQGEREKFEIIATKRVGITKGAKLPYRFHIKDNEFVSR